jgi:hypothetical protein
LIKPHGPVHVPSGADAALKLKGGLEHGCHMTGRRCPGKMSV